MEKSTIVYQIGDNDNKNKLENIFKELQVNYQLQKDIFVIYIPDVVIAKPVKREIPTIFKNVEEDVDSSLLQENEIQEKDNVRVCSLCSMCII